MKPPVLSAYTDYRQYLSDFFSYKKEIHRLDVRPYTYAMFSAAADIRSPNYLKLIIEGSRNLSDAMAQRFAKALQLSKEEAQEFCALVRFNQEVEPMKRNQYLKELADIRISQQINEGKIDTKTWEKVPNWITWVIQSIVDLRGAKFEAKELQRLFSSKVNSSDIDEALERLLQTGEYVRDETTREVRRARSLIESPENVPIELVRKLQSELMYLGLESLFRDDPSEREFGALTVALTQEEFEQIRFELRQLRKRINRDVAARREREPGNRVYQLNIQFFPVTVRPEISTDMARVLPTENKPLEEPAPLSPI